jgi:solute carrier family 25 phosphate transporter 23/24/25/41
LDQHVSVPVQWLLIFGTLSGSIGASSVYPLSLVRTRLQAQGTVSHPERYGGAADVVRKTYLQEGYRGFYKGLAPTLLKVVPAASISYVCYEGMKHLVGL